MNNVECDLVRLYPAMLWTPDLRERSRLPIQGGSKALSFVFAARHTGAVRQLCYIGQCCQTLKHSSLRHLISILSFFCLFRAIKSAMKMAQSET